jgi:hypothetical protein
MRAKARGSGVSADADDSDGEDVLTASVTVWLHMSAVKLDQVAWRIGEGREFTTTVPGRGLRLGGDPRLCLVLGDHPIVDGNEYGEWGADYDVPKDLYVLAVGRIRGSGRPATTDFRVKVDLLHPLWEPVKLRAVVREVPHSPRSFASIRTTIARELGPDTTTSYRAALDILFPGLGPIIDDLLGSGEVLTGELAAATLAEERDATHLALRIAGIDADPDDWWNDTASTYLSSLAYSPRESALLEHDAIRFGDFELSGGTRPDWQEFTDGQVSLRIANVDKTPLEETLGVDLIYRHLDADTFVLVQYKRMVKKSKGWTYRVDDQFYEELERMSRVDGIDKRKSQTGASTWRLNWGACWFKLVTPPETFDLASRKLLPGLYLPLEYAEELLEDNCTLGPRGGRRFRWDDIDRYVTSGMFTQLVREGWIGSRGLKTKALQKLVDSSLGQDRAVVLAEEMGTPRGSSRRTRPRRRLA